MGLLGVVTTFAKWITEEFESLMLHHLLSGISSVWLRARGLGPRGRRFESCIPDHFYVSVAHLVERLTSNQEAAGSSPVTHTTNK